MFAGLCSDCGSLKRPNQVGAQLVTGLYVFLLLLLFLFLCLFLSLTPLLVCFLLCSYSLSSAYYLYPHSDTVAYRSKSDHNNTIFTNKLTTYIIRPHTYYYWFNASYLSCPMVIIFVEISYMLIGRYC